MNQEMKRLQKHRKIDPLAIDALVRLIHKHGLTKRVSTRYYDKENIELDFTEEARIEGKVYLPMLFFDDLAEFDLRVTAFDVGTLTNKISIIVGYM